MSLNINNAVAPRKQSNRPLPKAGPQPARVVHVVDLGVQARKPFAGDDKPKPPIRQIFVNFELVNETHKDEENGKEYRLNISPRRFNFVNNDKATITKFMASIDPENKTGGDIGKIANTPCLLTVLHSKQMREGKEVTYANFGGVMPAPEGYPVKDLMNPVAVVEFDNPDEDAVRAIPQFLRDIMKEALDYKGSKMEAIITKIEAEKPNQQKAAGAAPNEDDAPY